MQNNNNSNQTKGSFDSNIPPEIKMRRGVTFSNTECVDDKLSVFSRSLSMPDENLTECKDSDSVPIGDNPNIDLESAAVPCNGLITSVVQPIFLIEDATVFTNNMDLFGALYESEAERLKNRNDKLIKHIEYPLAETNRVSSYDADETDITLLKFFEDKDVFCITLVPGMFYACNISVKFGYSKFHVKVFFIANKNPTIEFRELSGDSDIFFEVYNAFLDLFFGEKRMNRHSTTEIPASFSTILQEEEAGIASLVQYMKSSPENGIKMVATLAMEKELGFQIVMCNEVYNIIHTQRGRILVSLMSQILGFTEIVMSLRCLLDDRHKEMILSKLKIKLSSCVDLPDILVSVKIRANKFISSNIVLPARELLSLHTPVAIVEVEELNIFPTMTSETSFAAVSLEQEYCCGEEDES